MAGLCKREKIESIVGKMKEKLNKNDKKRNNNGKSIEK